jgi:hypothetical protein
MKLFPELSDYCLADYTDRSGRMAELRNYEL